MNQCSNLRCVLERPIGSAMDVCVTTDKRKIGHVASCRRMDEIDPYIGTTPNKDFFLEDWKIICIGFAHNGPTDFACGVLFPYYNLILSSSTPWPSLTITFTMLTRCFTSVMFVGRVSSQVSSTTHRNAPHVSQLPSFFILLLKTSFPFPQRTAVPAAAMGYKTDTIKDIFPKIGNDMFSQGVLTDQLQDLELLRAAIARVCNFVMIPLSLLRPHGKLADAPDCSWKGHRQCLPRVALMHPSHRSRLLTSRSPTALLRRFDLLVDITDVISCWLSKIVSLRLFIVVIFTVFNGE